MTKITDYHHHPQAMMKFSPRLSEYRETLAPRRVKPRTLYEALIAGTFSSSHYDRRDITYGIFNSRKDIWAIACDQYYIAFVWKTNRCESQNGPRFIIGANSYSEAFYVESYNKSVIGTTSLTNWDIEEVGKAIMFHC